jgi:redox-sensitive bicupin YhaK (pirin superfamily)
VKVIAGRRYHAGGVTAGAINPDATMATNPLYLDVTLAPGAVFTQPVAGERSVVVYTIEGEPQVAGADGVAKPLPPHAAGVLGAGDALEILAGAAGARFIVLAGTPIKEPVVQHGPFVMNTREEIEQALADYRDGTLALPA